MHSPYSKNNQIPRWVVECESPNQRFLNSFEDLIQAWLPRPYLQGLTKGEGNGGQRRSATLTFYTTAD